MYDELYDGVQTVKIIHSYRRRAENDKAKWRKNSARVRQ